MDNLVGHILKGYELRDKIGAGGFGAVYRAYQPAIAREVAIKIILPEYANQPDFIRRFEAEAQLVARLEHIHIVPLYDYWRDPGGAYLVMRFLRGGSLRDYLSRGPIEIGLGLRLLDQIASALTIAHRNNVVHRDMKPDNILLDEAGNAYLADFGIAKDLLDSTALQEDTDTLTGSPAYMSPEQIVGTEVTAQADIYSLGIVIYEMLTGSHPYKDASTTSLLFKHLNEPLPSVLILRPDLPEAVDDVLQRAANKDAASRYKEPVDLVAELRRALRLLESKHTVAISGDEALTLVGDSSTLTDIVLPQVQNPYKGLRAFQEADADDFFGREALIAQLITRLQETAAEARFLAVIGPSGSGKSSVIKAGLIPALRDGALPGSENWFIAEMLPGGQPLKELEAALLRVAVKPVDNLLDLLSASPSGLLDALAQMMPQDDTQLFLYIDQFEELFTLTDDEESREHFLDSLLNALTAPESRLRVMISLRADFYDRPLLYPAFGRWVRSRTEVVLPLNAEELERAISQPAQHVGLHLEPGLVKAIIVDVGEQPGALPLLQYALTELFERRVQNTLTLNAYVTSGGVFGALARRAEELYERLYEDEQKVARQLFLRLVNVGEGSDYTRRRALHTELLSLVGDDTPAMQEVIDLYGKYRLLTFDRDPDTRSPTIEVAHEALIRQWERLRQWLDENQDDLRLQRRLAGAAGEWLNAGQDPSFLAMGVRLQQFEDWLQATSLVLSETELNYLSASLARRERQQAEEAARIAYEDALEARSRQRLRALVVVLLTAVVIASGLTALAVGQSEMAQAARATSDINALRAENSAEEAVNLALASNAQLARIDQNSELSLALALAATRFDLPVVRRALYEAAYAPAMIRRLEAHTGPALAVAFLPDGKRALSGAADNTLILWDVETGQLIRQFERRHGDWVTSIAISPDGKTALSGSNDSTLILWEIETGRIIRRLTGHLLPVTSVAFSPDGQTVLSGSLDASVVLWDIHEGRVIRRFRQRSAAFVSPVRSVAYNPSGTSFASGGEDGVVTLWVFNTGKAARHLRPHTGQVLSLAFSPDGRYLASASADRRVVIWDFRKHAPRFTLERHSDWVLSVAYSPDGRSLISGAQDNTLIQWDTTSGTVIRRYEGHGASVRAVAFSSDDRMVISAGADKSVILWDTQSGDIVRHFRGHEDWVNTVVFSADDQMALSGSSDTSVLLWDVSTGALLRRFGTKFGGHSGPVWATAISPDGAYAVSGSDDTTLVLWDMQTGALIRYFRGHGGRVNSAVFSPDGRTLLSTSNDGSLILWDVDTGRLIRQYDTRENEHIGAVTAAIFTQDGRLMFSAGVDGEVLLWDVETAEVLRRYSAHTGAVYDLALSPDETRLASASNDTSLIVWDVQQAMPIYTLREHGSAVLSVAYAPDGQTVLSASTDRTLILWDLVTGTALSRLEGHTAPAASVAYSADGRFALSGAYDNTLILWRIDTLPQLIEWANNNRYARALTCGERDQYGLQPPCDADGQVPTRVPVLAFVASPTPAPVSLEKTAVPAASVTPTLLPLPTATATLIPPPVQLGENRGAIAAGDRDAWAFVGQAGAALRIAVYADKPANEYTLQERVRRGLLDTVLIVHGPDGQIIAESNDIKPGITDSRVDRLVLTASGTYVIEIRSLGEQLGGWYTLRIDRLD